MVCKMKYSSTAILAEIVKLAVGRQFVADFKRWELFCISLLTTFFFVENDFDETNTCNNNSFNIFKFI